MPGFYLLDLRGAEYGTNNNPIMNPPVAWFENLWKNYASIYCCKNTSMFYCC